MRLSPAPQVCDGPAPKPGTTQVPLLGRALSPQVRSCSHLPGVISNVMPGASGRGFLQLVGLRVLSAVGYMAFPEACCS